MTKGITIERDSAAAPFRFFYVTTTGNLTLQGLTVGGFLAQGFTGGDGLLAVVGLVVVVPAWEGRSTTKAR